MSASYENEDRSVVEFQLGNKQLFLLFLGLLVICAIFFFIGLRVGEDTARSRVPFDLSDNSQAAAPAESGSTSLTEQSLEVQPAQQPPANETRSAAADPTAANNQRPAERRAETAIPEKKPVVQPESGKRAEAKETKPAVQQPAGTGNLYVQVAAPTDVESAEKVRDRLAATFPARIVKVNVSGKDYFRVLIGPYANKEAAEEVRQAVLSSFKGAFIQVQN